MYNILVTGVGAIIGYGIIRSLRASPFQVRVIGADIYSDAVGQQWCDAFETAVLTTSPEHPDFIGDIIKKHAIDLVIPGIEQDATRMALDAYADLFPETRFVLNEPALVALAGDKWLTYLKQVEVGIPAIATRIAGEYREIVEELGEPFLLKPRRSYASKGIRTLESEEDFQYWKRKLGDNFMVQQIVGSPGFEYTVGVFGLGGGKYSGGICFQRRLSGAGATSSAIVRHLPELDTAVERLVDVFQPVGPTNFQFRFHEGQYLLLEINPRISASTSLRTAFGFNEAEMCIEYYLEGIEPAPRTIRPGSAVRYVEDIVHCDCDNF